jgi:hypothetical protein
MKMKISDFYKECFAQEGFIGNFHKKAVALHFGFVSDSRPNGRYASQNAKIQANARMRFCKAKYPKGETVCECKRESTSGQPHHFLRFQAQVFFK